MQVCMHTRICSCVYVCVYVSVCVSTVVPQYTYGGQKTNGMSPFSTSTMWIWGIELRWWGLLPGIFSTHWEILPDANNFNMRKYLF